MDIVTVIMHGEHDHSALQMISGRRLAYLHRGEALTKELVRELGQAVPPDAQAETPTGPQQRE